MAQAAIYDPSPKVATGSVMRYVGGLSAHHAGHLAAIAGVFAATDTLLLQSRAFPEPAAHGIAGCLAGGAYGSWVGGPILGGTLCAMFGAIQAVGAFGSRLPTSDVKIYDLNEVLESAQEQDSA